MFAWFHWLTDSAANSASKKVRKPRYWTVDEWSRLTAKERLWIWYKHHWMLIGQGSAEMDTVMFFTQGQFLTMMGVWLVVMQTYNLEAITIVIPFLLVVANKYVQWSIGNWKDNKDFIALDNEIGNRRNLAFRKIMQYEKEKPFRRNLK